MTHLMNDAAHLLSSACSAFKEAAQALNGPLERDVEASAAKCWDLRERSVQIKGRFMRTKTLIIEDPVFVDDEEHAFGDTLSKWEELGAGGVAAAALEGKIAHQRLLHATRKILLEHQESPERVLEALDSVLMLYEEVQQLENTLSDDGEKEFRTDSLQFVQQIACQVGHGYLGAVGGGGGDHGNDGTPSSQAVASLACVLARHGPSSAWSIGFLQPQPQDILPVLLALASEERESEITTATAGAAAATMTGRTKSHFAPIAISRILGQLDISSLSVISQLATSSEAYLLPQALVDVASASLGDERESSLEITGRGSSAGVIPSSKMCIIAVHKILVQLAEQATHNTTSDDENKTTNPVAAAVAEALLELLLATSKGISTTALRHHFNKETRNTSAVGVLQKVNISEVADWIYSFRPRSVINQNLILDLLSNLPWEWISVHCPSKRRLKWMLATVAAVKALREGGGEGGRNATAATTAAAERALSEILSGSLGWNFALGAFQNTPSTPELASTPATPVVNEEEGRMFCLLEAPLSEPPAVLRQWRQMQATVALTLCSTWMQSNRTERESIKEDVATLLESARVPDALTQSVHSTAATSLVCHVVNSTASAPEFLSNMYPTLSITLSAALAAAANTNATGTGTAVATALVEKAIGKLARACISNNEGEEKDRPFASLAAWIGLFVGILAQRDGLSSVETSPVVLTLVAKLTRTVYVSLPGKQPENIRLEWLLLHLANALRDQPVSHTQQLIAQLLNGGASAGVVGSSRESSNDQIAQWMRVLGAWIADAASLSSKFPQHGMESWSLSNAAAALKQATGTSLETTTPNPSLSSSTSPDEAEAAANEMFLLQDAIQSTMQSIPAGALPIPALVLCYELFWRISNNYAALSPLLDRQELTRTITSVSQQIQSKSSEVAESVISLFNMLEEGEGQMASSKGELLLPFVGNISVSEKVAMVLGETWVDEDWKASSSDPSTSGSVITSVDTLSRNFATSVSLAESAAAAAAVLPAHQPLPTSSSTTAGSADFLMHQQEEQASALVVSQEELRYWVRQGEKAAARPEGEEPAPQQGKEGDIPQPLATAQRHLWELEQRQHEELSNIHAALRQKICQQYNPIDEQFLQEASEAFSDGDRIPRAMLFRDSQHSAQCRELRKQAFHVALGIYSAKELSLAAKELFTFEYLLLEAAEKGETVQERAGIKSKLLAVMAHSIVNGSTPVCGIPYMVGLFERAVSGVGIVLDTDAKLRLIPRIAANLIASSSPAVAAMTGTGGGSGSGAPPAVQGVLREREGMRLLNACLDPDALLNAGKLREFMTALQLLVRLNSSGSGGGGVGSGSSSGQPSVMLSSFDAQRFAVLVAEKPGAVRASSGSSTAEAAGGSSSSGSGSASASTSSRPKGGKEVGVEEVLNLAAECLTDPSSAPTGSALLEGILNITPASLYAACLGVVLNAPATGRRDTLLSMLSQVPMEILDPPVLAESFSVLIQSLENGKIDPPDLPYGLLGALVRAVPVLESLRSGMETSKAVQVASGGKKSRSTGTERLDSFNMKKAAWTISGFSTSITLQPVSSSYVPLGTLAENALNAVMNAVLRVLRNTSGAALNTADSGNLSDLVQPVFGIAFELAGVCGLEWIWVFYQTHLCAFISDADKATAGIACAAAFQQYWASLPWNQATFHLESPLEIAKIRAYLPSADYAAARLVHDLDWTPILAAVLPLPKAHRSLSGGGGGSGAAAGGSEAGGVFTLLDEDEEDNALITPTPTISGSLHTTTTLDFSHYSKKYWAAELSLLLLHCSIYLPESPIGIPEWTQKLLLGVSNASVGRGAGGEQTEMETEQQVKEGEEGEEEVGIIRLLAASDWQLIESILLPPTTTTTLEPSSSSSISQSTTKEVPWLILPLLLAPGSIYGDVGERVVHAAYVLSRGAEKESSGTAARVVAKTVRPLLALSICQGVQIRMDEQMMALAGGRSGGRRAAVEEAATAAALAASIASHQLVDIPADIPEELLEGTVELEQLRLQREQIRLAQEEAAAAAAAAAAGRQAPQESAPPASGSAVPLIEVSGCFRFTPAQHVTLLRDVLGPLAAKHAQQPLNIAAITAEQCAPDLEPPALHSEEAGNSGNSSRTPTGGVVMWNQPSLAAFAALQNAISEEERRNKDEDDSAAAAVAAMLCVSLIQPLVLDPLTIITQDPLSYSNAEVPWVVENTSKAIFITNSSGSAGGSGDSFFSGSASASTRQRPGRSMRALRQQISSLLHRRDAQNKSSISNQEDSLTDPDIALNQAVTDALSLRNLMGHVIEDAAVRAKYSVENGKRLGACLLRCIILTPSVYYSAFVAHVAENVLRGLASALPSPSPSAQIVDAAEATSIGHHLPVSYQQYGHASEEVPVIEAASEHVTSSSSSSTAVASTSAADFASGIGGGAKISVPESMHFAAITASNLEPAYLLQFAQAAVRMRRPLLTTYALASARHAATLLDKISWQGLVIEALKVVQQSESNAEHPLDVVAPWLESLKWIGDTRWRRLPSGPHKSALNDFLSSLDTRVQVIEVLTPEEVGEQFSGLGGQRQQRGGERRNPLSAAANAASAAAGRVRQQLGNAVSSSSSSSSHASEPAVNVDVGVRTSTAAPPVGVPASISEFEPVQLSPEPQQRQQQQFGVGGVAVGVPEEDPSLSKKLASGFRSFGKSVSQAGSKLKNKLADLDGAPTSTSTSKGTPLPTTITTVGGGSSGGGGSGGGGSSIYPSAPTTSTTHHHPNAPQSRDITIEPERDHLVRVGLAAYAITAYIRSVMDPKLTRRTISGAEPSSPKHLRAGSFSTIAQHSVHIRGNSSLTGSRHLEEAQISELDTVLEAREAVDFLTQLEASPLIAHHRHVYAAFLDSVPQLLTAMTGVQTFVVAVVSLLVPDEDEAGQILALLSHSGA